jgi:hypothetical protein
MEELFQNLGLCYTVSKLLPYFLCGLLGLLIAYGIRKKFKSKLGKLVIFLFLPLITFGAYFGYKPIYEGDFSNNSVKFSSNEKELQSNNKKLTIIAIPNCPFCMDALQRIANVKKKNPKLNVEFIVCTLTEKALLPYKKSVDCDIKFSTTTNAKLMNQVAKGTFPTFIYSKQKMMKKWKNDDFGVCALDELIQEFSKR